MSFPYFAMWVVRRYIAKYLGQEFRAGRASQERRCLRHRMDSDTSPPNGFLLVNLPFGPVRQRERTLNQQLGYSGIRHGFQRLRA